MHFLDDKAEMTALLIDRSDEWVCLAKLALDGGRGYLRPRELAKALRSHQWQLEHSIHRLVSARRIEPISKKDDYYAICGFENSQVGSAFALAETPKIQIAKAPEPEPEPDAKDFSIVHEYHRACKVGGPYIEAAEYVRQLRQAGWEYDDLRLSILGYKKSTTNPLYYRSAKNFFEPVGEEKRFYGAQFIELGRQSLEAPKEPKAAKDILSVEAIFKQQRGNA